MIYDLQKADFWKRISAFIFDQILVFTLAVGFAFLLSLVVGFDQYSEIYNERCEHYSAEYGIDVNTSPEDEEKLSEQNKQQLLAAREALLADESTLFAVAKMISLVVVIIVFSLLASYMTLEFLVPLFFKNGQTFGKKIFGIAVVRMDGVKISPLFLCVRTLLGKYTVETMVPVFTVIGIFVGSVNLIGLAAALGVVIANVIMLLSTKNRTPIHDKLASTVVVDMATQMIFDSPEQMLEYKEKLHAEEAASAEY